MSKHYICMGGCKGVSPTPNVCQGQDCAYEGFPLESCDCTDEKHYGAFDRPPATEPPAATPTE